jgi:asparagine synthase (glutamine-hydrolysing)
MSFLAGVFCFDGRPIPGVEVAAIRDQTGPEDDGVTASHLQDGLLMTQFSTSLEVGKGSRPRVSAAGAITFDGRLDNRDYLLLRLRHVLREDRSDAALAQAAYEQWGPGGLVHLVGDWSLVIWDEARSSIVLASDFAGVRPLYYCVQPNRVLWSTRLSRLVDLVQASEIDDQYVAGLLMFAGCPNRTPYRGIYPVPAGHSVQAGGNGIKLDRFWTPPIGKTVHFQHESEYEEQLRALFRQAVRHRLASHATVLCDLSGGLDSSSIVCFAAELMRSGAVEAPRIVTLTCQRQGSLDKPVQTAVENQCGFESIHVSADDYPFLTETETGGAQPAFWQTLHSQVAAISRNIGAATYCTGQAGDLSMGNWWDDSDQVAGLLRAGRIGSALHESLSWSKSLRVPIYWVLWRSLLLNLPPSIAPGANRRGDRATPASSEDSLTRAFRKRSGLSREQTFFSTEWMHAAPERRKHVRALTETLESRKLQPPEPLQHLNFTHPYIHRPLVEFMLSIPAGIVCRPGEPRRLMRRAFQELWPPELRRRRSKDSFSSVFLDSLRPLGDKLRKEPRLQVVERGYVDPQSLKTRLDNLAHSMECNEPQLRQIILLEVWLRSRENQRRSDNAPISASA